MKSLRSRVALLVLLALAPGFGLIWFASRAEREARARAAVADVGRTARQVAEQQARNVDAVRGLLTSFAQAASVQGGDAGPCRRIAAATFARLPFLSVIGAATPDGRVICHSGPSRGEVRVDDRLYFRRALATWTFSAGDVQVSRTTGRPSLHFAQPVLSPGGELLGVVFAGVDAAYVAEQLADQALPDGAVVYVTDAEGVVMAGTGLRPGDRVPEVVRARLAGGAAGQEVLAAVGRERVFAFDAVDAPDGTRALRVAVGVPVTTVFAPVDASFRRALLGYGGVALLAFALAAAAGQVLLVGRIDALIGAARRLSAGDYGARSGLASAGGELGELGRAFDEMAESLRTLTREHRRVLACAGDGILGVDREWRITLANPAAEALLDVAPGGALGRRLGEFLPDGPAGGAGAARPPAELPHRREVRVVRADGSAFPAECLATPTVEDGAVVGAVVTLKDVRERRQLEEHLRKAQKMEAVGLLAGGVAHDFNNLLTAILGAGQLAREALGDHHPARADLDEILAAARRGAELTRRLLAFGGRHAAHTRVFDVCEAVASTQGLVLRLLGERVRLEARIAPQRCLVRADPALVEQAVMNLAVNGRDAMPQGGSLEIEVRPLEPGAPELAGDPALPPGPAVMIAVRDSGVGMDEATRARIFEPFYTTKLPGRGTGLGLSTVYAAARQAGGTVKVESTPGGGSTFRIFLPRCPETAAADPTPAPLRVRGSEAVLLVDGDAAVRGVARRALASAGYQVLEAERPSAALAAVEGRGAPDLLVTDLVLPESTGRDLADALATRCPGLRVLYVSGHGGARLDEAATAGVGRGFLAKPFAPDALLARVRELLDAPRPAVD